MPQGIPLFGLQEEHQRCFLVFYRKLPDRGFVCVHSCLNADKHSLVQVRGARSDCVHEQVPKLKQKSLLKNKEKKFCQAFLKMS